MSTVIVCLDQDRPGRLAEFRRTAKRLAAEHKAKLHFLHTGRALVELAAQHEPQSVDHLMVCAHGGTTWLIHPAVGVSNQRTGSSPCQATVREFADAWAPVFCLRSPHWWMRRVFGAWSSRSYKRGGQFSFGGQLRDQLVRHGLRPQIRGHRSAGHLTKNPILAEFRGVSGELCVPLFELALPSEPITIVNRRRWARKPAHGGFVSGERAERWLLFDDSVVEEIAQHWHRPKRFADGFRIHSSRRDHSTISEKA
jgi:hypothetical protein